MLVSSTTTTASTTTLTTTTTTNIHLVDRVVVVELLRCDHLTFSKTAAGFTSDNIMTRSSV